MDNAIRCRSIPINGVTRRMTYSGFLPVGDSAAVDGCVFKCAFCSLTCCQYQELKIIAVGCIQTGRACVVQVAAFETLRVVKSLYSPA